MAVSAIPQGSVVLQEPPLTCVCPPQQIGKVSKQDKNHLLIRLRTTFCSLQKWKTDRMGLLVQL